MALSLTIDATVAEDFHIEATGRNADRCARTSNNLIFDDLPRRPRQRRRPRAPPPPSPPQRDPPRYGLRSSAAALLAGVLLANHFGHLGWTSQPILEEACRREGHPDNVAACSLGDMTDLCHDAKAVHYCSNLRPRSNLEACCLALPSASLATERPAPCCPPTYTRADAVANIQCTALLVAAFALGRGDLLRIAMQDRIHQPYRMEACPLLPLLLPLAENPGILGVALSGAGPSVLLDRRKPRPSALDSQDSSSCA